MSGENGASQGSETGGEAPSSESTATAPTTTAPPTGGAGSQGSAQQSDNSYVNSFLQNVPEDQRAALEPFVRQWDAGVTRRFQDLHSQYAPFKPILDQGATPEQLDLAWTVFQLLDNDPKALQTILSDVLEEVGQAEGQGSTPLPTATGEDPWESLPPALKQQFEEQQSLLENMAQWILSQNQSTVEQAEDQQLEEYLTNLKTEMGDFDEEYVVSLIAAGLAPDDAVRKYQSLTQNILSKREAAGDGPSAQVPPILSSGGVVSSGKPVEQASANETRSLVADILRASNNSGR